MWPTPKNFAALPSQSIFPHARDRIVFTSRPARAAPFSREDSKYGPAGDVYVCPGGKTLITTGTRANDVRRCSIARARKKRGQAEDTSSRLVRSRFASGAAAQVALKGWTRRLACPWKRLRTLPGSALTRHGPPARVFAPHLGSTFRKARRPIGPLRARRGDILKPPFLISAVRILIAFWSPRQARIVISFD